MPDDRLRELFDRAAAEQVDVPPVAMVRARGQQRRSRARLQASTVAWTIMLAMGFGAPQVSGSLATGSQQSGTLATAAPASGTSYPSPLSARDASSATPPVTTPADHRRHTPRATFAPSSGKPVTRPPTLPPRGNGQLILALDSAREYVMTRIGSARAPVRLAGLKSVRGAPPVLATNPSGGWVVAFATRRPAGAAVRDRLALVVASGHSVPFGPWYGKAAVTSAAVSQDGSRVAVAITQRSGGARIEVLPLPGHQEKRQSWSVPAAQADLVTALSWSPDGRHLSYLTDQTATDGAPGGPVILNTAAKVAQMPEVSGWTLAMKTGVACLPRAAAWLGASGRFAVLSECMSTGEAVLETSDASTGVAVGQPLVVSHKVGCANPALNSNASGSEVVISYCGVYLDDRGALSRQTAELTAAALAG
ncbi:MAG TPA: hypothetical protein VJT16_16060 [Streptosporangiaceae bacterium]|jgi:hypothetical protein|nr:hypothetical protein [Streptosporangiaceae bacterium]